MENKYITQATKGKTNAWRYALGIFATFIGVFIFSMPYSKILNQIADPEKLKDFNYLMTLMDSNRTLFYLMLPFLGGIIALYLIVTKVHKLSWINFTTSRLQIDFKRVFFSFFLWGGISLALILASAICYPKEIVLNFNASKFMVLFVVGVIMIPIQTSFEEYLFRGYLMQGLGLASKTNIFPLLVTSITFGLMHISNPEVAKLGYGIMAFYIGTGLFLGIITLMDQGMELALGFHAANNLITALMVTTDWTAFQTHAIFKDLSVPSFTIELLALSIIYPLLLVILAKKYNWKNWKEKLV